MNFQNYSSTNLWVDSCLNKTKTNISVRKRCKWDYIEFIYFFFKTKWPKRFSCLRMYLPQGLANFFSYTFILIHLQIEHIFTRKNRQGISLFDAVAASLADTFVSFSKPTLKILYSSALNVLDKVFPYLVP